MTRWEALSFAPYDIAVHLSQRARYPGDFSDDEWRFVEPFIPPAPRGGRKRHLDASEVINSIFHGLAISRGSVYLLRRPASDADLSTARRIDELQTEGRRMLRGFRLH